MRVEETAVSYSSDIILVDALIGILALPLIAVAALLLGGFSFFTPWLIVSPFMMLVAGLLRSRSEGVIWLKCLVICAAPLVFSVFISKSFVVIGITAPLLLLPCAGGVWLRRRLSVNPADELTG
jgi:hypothetical protein